MPPGKQIGYYRQAPDLKEDSMSDKKRCAGCGLEYIRSNKDGWCLKCWPWAEEKKEFKK
jgi:hypothetical protein